MSSDSILDDQVKQGILRLIMKRFPSVNRKGIIFLERGLIIKSDNDQVKLLRNELGKFEYHNVVLMPRLTSGSISKLKRLVNIGGG
jgi:hypothetical protein